mmetsp:Transcript_10730/g.30466  ORF Transcript_10730/g.30466 Transcript_10730/m.30466 type:complete len:579 (-) Transcript_10730:2424-4160(-)
MPLVSLPLVDLVHQRLVDSHERLLPGFEVGCVGLPQHLCHLLVVLVDLRGAAKLGEEGVSVLRKVVSCTVYPGIIWLVDLDPFVGLVVHHVTDDTSTWGVRPFDVRAVPQEHVGGGHCRVVVSNGTLAKLQDELHNGLDGHHGKLDEDFDVVTTKDGADAGLGGLSGELGDLILCDGALRLEVQPHHALGVPVADLEVAACIGSRLHQWGLFGDGRVVADNGATVNEQDGGAGEAEAGGEMQRGAPRVGLPEAGDLKVPDVIQQGSDLPLRAPFGLLVELVPLLDMILWTTINVRVGSQVDHELHQVVLGPMEHCQVNRHADGQAFGGVLAPHAPEVGGDVRQVNRRQVQVCGTLPGHEGDAVGITYQSGKHQRVHDSRAVAAHDWPHSQQLIHKRQRHGVVPGPGEMKHCIRERAAAVAVRHVDLPNAEGEELPDSRHPPDPDGQKKGCATLQGGAVGEVVLPPAVSFALLQSFEPLRGGLLHFPPLSRPQRELCRRQGLVVPIHVPHADRLNVFEWRLLRDGVAAWVHFGHEIVDVPLGDLVDVGFLDVARLPRIVLPVRQEWVVHLQLRLHNGSG